MSVQGSLSIERMCQLAGVSRAGFYRSLQEQGPAEEEMEVRSAIQGIAFGASTPLRLSADHRGTATARDAGESQTRCAPHARR